MLVLCVIAKFDDAFHYDFAFKFMIELTTGVAFLMTSMYGSGSMTASVANVQPANTNTTANTAIVSPTDRKAMEQYLKEKFADTPILVEVARCESTFTQFDKNGQVIRGRANRADVGVMQINEKYHLETAEKMGIDIYTVDGNIAYAKYLYSKFGTDPWSSSSPCWGNTLAMK